MEAHQALPSLGFSRQEHWSGLPFPSPMHEREKWKWSCSVYSASKDIQKKPQLDSRRGILMMWSDLIPPRWAAHRLENISQVLHRSQSSKPHIRLTSLGVASGGGALRVFGFQAQQECFQELHRTGENIFHPWGEHARACKHQDPEEKQWLHRNLGQTYLLVLEGLLGKQGVAVPSEVIRVGGRHLGVFICMNSPWGRHLAWVFSTKTWPYWTACRLQCWHISSQTAK